MPRKPLSQFVEECRASETHDVLPFPDTFARYVDQLQAETQSPPEAGDGGQVAFVTASGLMFLLSPRVP